MQCKECNILQESKQAIKNWMFLFFLIPRFLTRSNLGNGGCGNLYTPNPVEASAQAANLSSMLSNSSSNNNETNSNNNDSSSQVGQLRSSWSLRSFRTWLPWVNQTSSSSQCQTPNSENRLVNPFFVIGL